MGHAELQTSLFSESHTAENLVGVLKIVSWSGWLVKKMKNNHLGQEINSF